MIGKEVKKAPSDLGQKLQYQAQAKKFNLGGGFLSKSTVFVKTVGGSKPVITVSNDESSVTEESFLPTTKQTPAKLKQFEFPVCHDLAIAGLVP